MDSNIFHVDVTEALVMIFCEYHQVMSMSKDPLPSLVTELPKATVSLTEPEVLTPSPPPVESSSTFSSRSSVSGSSDKAVGKQKKSRKSIVTSAVSRLRDMSAHVHTDKISSSLKLTAYLVSPLVVHKPLSEEINGEREMGRLEKWKGYCRCSKFSCQYLQWRFLTCLNILSWEFDWKCKLVQTQTQTTRDPPCAIFTH